jgi:dimethylaniline monooxygenase (N-oxide forming)
LRVCVIGAGVAGLVSAKVLKQDGFEVTVYEKETAIGGVWAPSRAYADLRTNNPRETYAFSDFAYPEETDEFPTAPQVQSYLESYAEHYGIRPSVRLGTEVVSVARGSATGDGSHPGFRLTVRPSTGPGDESTEDFDFVTVSNGVFSQPYTPRLPGQDEYAGVLIHSSQLTDAEVITGKRVVVVGAGKSALDCATVGAHLASSCTLVFRTPHWMLPRYFFGRVRVDRVLFTRLSEFLLPTYHSVGRGQAALRMAAAPLLWVWRRAMSKLVPRLTGMPRYMVPETLVTSGAQNIGIGEKFYRALRQGSVRAKQVRELAFSGEDRLRIDDSDEIEADVVIFATGWEQGLPFLDPKLRREALREGRFHLYRHILPPAEPRLGFVGYASSANSPLTSEVAAHWLSQCFLRELQLPDPAAMDREIARVREWAATTFPRRSEGYFIGGYVAQYIDELLRDMGLSPRRAASLLSEFCGPIWAQRYAGLAAERARLRAQAKAERTR